MLKCCYKNEERCKNTKIIILERPHQSCLTKTGFMYILTKPSASNILTLYTTKLYLPSTIIHILTNKVKKIRKKYKKILYI